MTVPTKPHRCVNVCGGVYVCVLCMICGCVCVWYVLLTVCMCVACM